MCLWHQELEICKAFNLYLTIVLCDESNCSNSNLVRPQPLKLEENGNKKVWGANDKMARRSQKEE